MPIKHEEEDTTDENVLHVNGHKPLEYGLVSICIGHCLNLLVQHNSQYIAFKVPSFDLRLVDSVCSGMLNGVATSFIPPDAVSIIVKTVFKSENVVLLTCSQDNK